MCLKQLSPETFIMFYPSVNCLVCYLTDYTKAIGISFGGKHHENSPDLGLNQHHQLGERSWQDVPLMDRAREPTVV